MAGGSNTEKILGLIGYPLSHSFSEKYFTEKFRKEGIGDFYYRNFPIQEIGSLISLIQDEPGLVGLNVTIPYKEQVIEYLDDIDDEAREVGAVNTILISRDSGKVFLKGFNTDVYGFRESLYPLLQGQHKNALVLGTGGASKAICHVLDQMGIAFQYVSRTYKPGHLEYKDLCLSIIRNSTLIINTTPLGTYPDVSKFPDIPYDILGAEHLLYDLVYNPPETAFLRLGKQKGAAVKNGLEMLELQAWEIWTGKD
ncbi:shikimate dehydrogenase family protein [Bacteroidota bacterium]